MYCENCGSKLPDGAKFCMDCGTKAANAGPANEKAAKETAAAADAAVAGEVSPVDFTSPEARESSSDQAGTPIIDDRPAQQSEAAQQPEAARQPEAAKPAYTWPAPPQATPGSAQSVQPPGAAPGPVKTVPLSVWKYLGMIIVMCIPVLGFIMILVWSFGSSFNLNTRNFARASLILCIIGFILSIATVVAYWSFITSIMNNFKQFTPPGIGELFRMYLYG